MSDQQGALHTAQEQLQELLEAAKTGAIIPARLPGQIEAIAALLQRAEQEQQEQRSQPTNALPPDMESYMEEEAYFVGHAVHELRTPMTSIRGYSDMLGSMGELNDMQTQFLGVIKTNARRMESLLQDVSHANKLRKGTLKPRPKMDTFKNLALKLEKQFAERAEELKRQFTMDVPQGLPLLNVDSDLLAIALGKFVENGLQYSPEGSGTVRLTASADGDVLVIQIEDNGIGMSEEELAQLGTIYFRSERDEVREYKGSGLGIPIALGMLELIGAEVDIQSAVDQGTRITVRIQGMS